MYSSLKIEFGKIVVESILFKFLIVINMQQVKVKYGN